MSRDKHTDHHVGQRHLDRNNGTWQYDRDQEPEANDPYVRGQVRDNRDTPNTSKE